MCIVRCSFCGKSQNDVPRLVASTTSASAICAPCVLRSIEVLVSGNDEPAEPVFIVTPEGEALAARMTGVPPPARPPEPDDYTLWRKDWMAWREDWAAWRRDNGPDVVAAASEGAR